MLNYFYLGLYAITVLITLSAASRGREFFWITVFISLMYAGAWNSEIWNKPESAMFVDLCAMLAMYALLSENKTGRRLIGLTFCMVMVDAMSYAFLGDVPRGSYYSKTLLNLLFIGQCLVSIDAGIRLLRKDKTHDKHKKHAGLHRKVFE